MEQNPYAANALASDAPKGPSVIKSLIKTLLAAIGIIALVIVGLVVWGGFNLYGVYQDFEGKDDPFIYAMLKDQSPWNYEQFQPLLSENWPHYASEDETRGFLDSLNRLGEFQSVEHISRTGCKVASHTHHDTVERCDYEVVAHYQKGTANFHLGLVYEHDQIKLMQIVAR